jgi:2-polyprenyl-6-methoxyphenol hydroxylase-like FAD-dependent oxidoreductase
MSEPVIIVGAGPVGTLLACLLGKKGIEVTLYEKRVGLPDASMAIGITPPSLDILETVGLKSAFLKKGVLIPRARVYEGHRLTGILDFSPDQQILSLPQYDTLKLLRERLNDFKTVQFHEGTAWEPELPAPGWLIACDGAHSPLRDHFNIPHTEKTYPVTFVMADFPDSENLGPDARIWFSPEGAVESFPLPGLKRRWIAQCAKNRPADILILIDRVRDLAQIDLTDRDHTPAWPFTPRRLLCHDYVHENLILCGDAAHIMSPIGGQGMNTGFADAAHLSRILPSPSVDDLKTYTRHRSQAFRTASHRVALGMTLGTRTGPFWSPARHQILKILLNCPQSKRFLADTFAMKNLPSLISPP